MNTKQLVKLEDIALSSIIIKKLLPNIKIIEYSQLQNMKSIDEAFDKMGRFMLFFATESANIGHWECVFKQGNNIIFFDSYGLDVDMCKDYVKNNLLIKLKEYPDYLSNLLSKSGYNVYHNSTKYQEMIGDISTCGRHCINRLTNKNLTAQQYLQLMNNLKQEFNSKTYDAALTEYQYKNYNI